MNDTGFDSASSEPARSPGTGTTTLEIGRIHPLQAGKVLGLLYLLFGVIIVPFFVIAAMAQENNAAIAGVMGVGIGMLIMYPVMGFLGGVIAAFLYNFIAKTIGGIRFDLG